MKMKRGYRRDRNFERDLRCAQCGRTLISKTSRDRLICGICDVHKDDWRSTTIKYSPRVNATSETSS